MFTLMPPRRVRFGAGAFEEVGREAAELGSRALVVCGRRAMRANGVVERLAELLAKAGVGLAVFDEVEHDPCRETVDRGTQVGRRERCDVVIGLGGGSSLDAAKAIAVMVNQEGALADYHDGRRAFEQPALPMIAVPTTAGSGAEATRNAVLTDRANGEKKSLRGPGMGVSVALVDPQLTLSLPPRTTAHSGMDALAQAMECYISAAAHAVSDALSLKAVGLIMPKLERAFHEGHDLRHREPVMLGSLLAGMAFADAGLGAVHGLAHPLGSHLGLPHGYVCAVLLPAVLEFNYDVRRERFEAMAGLLHLGSGTEVVDAVRRLNAALGIPETLRGDGLTEALFPAILRECRGNSMSNNPRPASDEDLIGILGGLL